MSQDQVMQLLREGVTLTNAGNHTAACDYFRAAIELDPHSEVAWLWLASSTDSPLEGLHAIESVLRINPKNPRARESIHLGRLRAGIHYAKLGQRSLAREKLIELVQSDPNNELGWLWLASTADTNLEAIHALEQALRINPNNEQARQSLNIQRTQHFHDRAIWNCPFCGHGCDSRQAICPNCRSMQILNSIDVLLNNRELRTDFIRPGMARLEQRSKSRNEFTTEYYLAIGYLQLRDIEQSLYHFRKLLSIQHHEAIRLHYQALEKRQAQKEREAQLAAIAIAAEQPMPRQKSVMIIDDSVTIRKIVRMTLTDLSVQVIEAADAEEARESIASDGAPDLILLDSTLPETDGYTLCREFRARKETATTPIILLSGKDGMLNKMRGRIAGATHYLMKPVQAESLLELVQQYCRLEFETLNRVNGSS